MLKYSINKHSNFLLNNLIKNADGLGLIIKKGPLNSIIVDAGIDTHGSIEAGIKISEICLGGLGKVSVTPSFETKSSFNNISVHASNPVLACLGSQYAGWSLSHKDFFSLGSGPARSLAQKEEIFSKLKYTDKSSATSIVLEVDKIPPDEIIKKVSFDCNVPAEEITFILTPTTSICGTIQIVSRVLEVAIHKIHELNYPLEKVLFGIATAPLPPVASDFISGMGRTNDAIIYGGRVYLCIDDDDDEIKKLAKNLPSFNSKDYGKPFKQIFLDYEKDFYKIDGSLFSPATVLLNSKKSGQSYSSGEVSLELVEQSFKS